MSRRRPEVDPRISARVVAHHFDLVQFPLASDKEKIWEKIVVASIEI